MSPPWLQFFPILIIIYRRLWTIWSVLNSMIIWGGGGGGDVLKSWSMMIALWLPEPLSSSTLALSFICLIILLILYSIYGEIIKIRGLNSLLINFIIMMRIPCDLSISLPMGPLFKRLCVNTITLLNQIRGNPMVSKKSIKMIICLWMFPLVKLKRHYSRPQINMVSIYSTVWKTMNLMENHIQS